MAKNSVWTVPRRGASCAVVLALLWGADLGCDLGRHVDSDDSTARTERDADTSEDRESGAKERTKHDKDTQRDQPKPAATASAAVSATASAAASATASAAAPAASAEASPLPPAPNVDLFHDATGIPAMLKARVDGPVRIQELALFPNRAYVDIQDPKQLLHVDRFEIRASVVRTPTPVELFGPKPEEELLRKSTFNIDEVDFGVVGKIVNDASVQLKLDGGTTSHVNLRRGLPFHDRVLWRVFVGSPRRSGFVDYDLKGAVVKVSD